MIAYHEIQKDCLDAALKEGLKTSSSGDKNDKYISKTDDLLDHNIPHQLKRAGINRNSNLYCYFAYKNKVLDITDGQFKDPLILSKSADHILLKVNVDSTRCYVSDLDLYDKMLNEVKYSKVANAQKLAQKYWGTITRLDIYNHEQGVERPEVMVTYDIPSSQLEVVKS
jgi:hypothetical protein